MQHEKLTMAAIGAVAALGEVFTDARECGAQVAAAENLKVLASLLGTKANFELQGELHADGEVAGTATAYIDGELAVTLGDDVDTSCRAWHFVTKDGKAFRVALFMVGDGGDSESWVIDAAHEFYCYVLGIPA